ncbi:nidogen-like domain-containing protein [Ditylenchus destructor]|uniref:Nidogen-like domain-containing protein n=1 Tax=Ditylenchus destructor TaxID=166010 RepID=A0AAD4QV35_9BILA|nr:nidogen-like domain-containing protein [Ditylenchus destructor]
MHRILFIWCTLLFSDSYAAVPLEEFFLFGGENGDERLSQQMFNWLHIDDLKPPFKIFGEKRDYVYVNDGGYFDFENGKINVMRGWINLRKVGDVYWRESRSRIDLDKAQEEIRLAFPAYQAIDLKWVLIVTWYQVTRSAEKPFPRNTFQFILTTDKIRSFAIFYYNNIEWYIEGYSTAGFEIKKYDERYIATTHKYVINGTDSRDMLTIGNRSNVGSPGKWLFRIDQDTIYEPNSLCAMPPQPENGICMAEEITPGSLARCNCTHGCKMYKEEFLLECTAPEENETAVWTGKMPECRPLNATTTECRTRFSCQCPTRPSCQCPSCESPIDLPSSTNSSVKLCPFPPIPQNGVCGNSNYSPGSSAKCKCLPNFRNINSNSQLYCVFAEDGHLFWSGEMPACVNSSMSTINN